MVSSDQTGLLFGLPVTCLTTRWRQDQTEPLPTPDNWQVSDGVPGEVRGDGDGLTISHDVNTLQPGDVMLCKSQLVKEVAK